MSNVIIDDTHLNNIANAIRTKNGLSDKYKPSEMATAINQLEEVTDYIDSDIAKDLNTDYLLNRIILKVPYLDTSRMTTLSYAFQRCNRLEELQELDASNLVNITNIFASCNALKHFGGLKDLGKAYLPTAPSNYSYYTLNLTSTDLDYESLMNVINKVADIKSLGIASQTIRVSEKMLALLSEADIAKANLKGWNITT